MYLKNAVGSKLDLFQAKSQAVMAWTEAPAVCPSAGITALLLWRMGMLTTGFVGTSFAKLDICDLTRQPDNKV